ncbi:hypothetical protein GCM10009733_037590 [Nonomuraea maheshkhaliensis]|uniref:Uncharacterized protein n=1 Tax=Nonomuraea maheshkhaliensis TaxID=419590 RepID=A0ABP4R563_9ACTN
MQGSAVSTQIDALSESTYRSIGPTTSAGNGKPPGSTFRHTLVRKPARVALSATSDQRLGFLPKLGKVKRPALG